MQNQNETLNDSPDKKLNAQRILEQTEQELERMAALVNPMLELRHKLFDVEGTEFSKEASISSQLYDLPDYNDSFLRHDIGVRENSVREYHNTTESYDDDPDSPEKTRRNRIYRREIMHVAQELGFISKEPGVSDDPKYSRLNITQRELEPIQEPVAAVIVYGAAGMSNIFRVMDMVENIESGKIKTENVIMAAGQRPVDDKEKGRVAPPYRAGDSEFESLRLAVEDMTGAVFDQPPTEIDVPYGDNLKAKYQTTQAVIGDKNITFHIIEAPYDEKRIIAEGKEIPRTNTDEANRSTLPILSKLDGAVVLESHDTWVPWQEVLANDVFGLGEGRRVYATGPLKTDRVFWTEEDGKKIMDVNRAQDVADELMKTYQQLVTLQIAAKEAAA